MIDLLSNNKSCTGCSACYSSCKHEAITMMPDNLGFLYPTIDNEKCVEYGLCLKVCPMNKELLYNDSNKVVRFGISKDVDTILSSSSGGAFTEIIKLIESTHDLFHCYAAEYSNGHVLHVCIDSSSKLSRQKNQNIRKVYYPILFVI